MSYLFVSGKPGLRFPQGPVPWDVARDQRERSTTRLETRSKEFSTCAKANSAKLERTQVSWELSRSEGVFLQVPRRKLSEPEYGMKPLLMAI